MPFSAKQYSQCPQCFKNAGAALAEAMAAACDAYGKVSQEAYSILIAVARDKERLAQRDFHRSLDESLTIGFKDNGAFYFAYTATCGVCRFYHQSAMDTPIQFL